MLVLDRLSAGYKTKKETFPVFEDLSLRVEQGEVLAMLGPSGCGKSTLIHVLAGTLAPTGGTMEFQRDDQRLLLHPKTHKIAMIPQNCGLLPWKRVRANCLLPLQLRHEVITGEREEDIQRTMTDLDIADLQQRYPKELSGGQVQRVAIARAFIQQPDLLLMDEPFSSLDAILREEAGKLFLRVWQQAKPTTMLVTHSLEEALFLGHTVMVMAAPRGQIKFQLRNPFFAQLHPDSAEYLALAQQLRRQLLPYSRETADA